MFQLGDGGFHFRDLIFETGDLLSKDVVDLFNNL